MENIVTYVITIWVVIKNSGAYLPKQLEMLALKNIEFPNQFY